MYQLTTGGETFTTTLEAFLSDNPHLEGTLDELACRLLEPGDSVTVDEGAAGTWTLARVS